MRRGWVDSGGGGRERGGANGVGRSRFVEDE